MTTATATENAEFEELETAEAIAEAQAEDAKDFGTKLAEQTSGIRYEQSKLSTTRSMTKIQVVKVAETFQAAPDSVGGRRAVINRKHPLVAPVLTLLTEAKRYVESRTIAYPDQGMRLIRLNQVDSMTQEIAKRREQLDILLGDLDQGWESVKNDAKERLQDLYQESDYPEMPSAAFSMHLSFPAIQPDHRLKKLNAALYEAEAKRIAGKFTVAVEQAEAAAAEKLQELIQHFVDRLVPDENGNQKQLRASTLTNIKDFAEQFKATTIGSNEGLEAMVAKVEALAGGCDVDGLRKDTTKSQKTAADFTKLLGEMDQLVISKPVREFDLED